MLHHIIHWDDATYIVCCIISLEFFMMHSFHCSTFNIIFHVLKKIDEIACLKRKKLHPLVGVQKQCFGGDLMLLHVPLKNIIYYWKLNKFSLLKKYVKNYHIYTGLQVDYSFVYKLLKRTDHFYWSMLKLVQQ